MLSEDSIDLGLYCSWMSDVWDNLVVDFNRYRELAANTQGILFPLIAGSLMLPYGKAPQYRWQIRCPEMFIYLQTSNVSRQAPNVYVSMLSEALHQHGIEALVAMARERVETLLGTVDRIQVSRVDLAADFLLPEGLSHSFLYSHLVPSHRKLQSISLNQNLETFYVGAKSSPIQMRIYDKAKEILTSSYKTWFGSLWGLETIADVWRVEFQLRRPVLRELQINTLEEFLEKRASIWKYLTEEWASLRLPDDSNTTRRTVHPFWKAVQEAGSSWGDATKMQRVKSPPTFDLDRKIAVILGHLIALAALLGVLEIREVFGFLEKLLPQNPKFHEFSELVRIKMIQLGLTPPRRGGPSCS